eukprot:4153493-Amphidinium_carterae.4
MAVHLVHSAELFLLLADLLMLLFQVIFLTSSWEYRLDHPQHEPQLLLRSSTHPPDPNRQRSEVICTGMLHVAQ